MSLFRKPRLTRYEKSELTEIGLWKATEPSVVGRRFGVVLEPVAWLVKKVVPPEAVQRGMELADRTGLDGVDLAGLLGRARVQALSSIGDWPLHRCDRLAVGARRRAVAAASVQGVAAGSAGLLTAPVDVALLLRTAVSSIATIGLCYGVDPHGEGERAMRRAVLAAATANDLHQKEEALMALRALAVSAHPWARGKEEEANAPLEELMDAMPGRIAFNLCRRRVLSSIPVVGAAVGGSLNAWFLSDVCQAARRSYQERWFLEHRGLRNVPALATAENGNE